MDQVFKENQIDVVIHLAGFKSVNESIEKPIDYYLNNVYGSLILLDVMKNNNVKKVVFSSSATVYGLENKSPISEDASLRAINPYGETKLMVEKILKDIQKSDSEWKVISLRYFNPIGAHKSALIGEDPRAVPANIMPYITQVAVGKLEELRIFGDDYPTRDGTGVRDYIHVVDLALGHIKALQNIDSIEKVEFINLGTGKGYSVLELIKAFEDVSSKKIKFKIVDRRPGDIAECYANPNKANKLLNWYPMYDINDMCLDSWNYERNKNT